MESLQELRVQLDEIDAQIVDLYQKRMAVCEKVGEYKVTSGKIRYRFIAKDTFYIFPY